MTRQDQALSKDTLKNTPVTASLGQHQTMNKTEVELSVYLKQVMQVVQCKVWQRNCPPASLLRNRQVPY